MRTQETVIPPVHGPPAMASEEVSLPAARTAGSSPATGRNAFSQVLATVKRGDTLIGMVKSLFRNQGLSVSENQAWRLAHRIAADNRLLNANRIEPGQQINLTAALETTDARLAARARLMASLTAPASSTTSHEATGAAGRAVSDMTATGAVPAPVETAAAALTAERTLAGPHPVLEKTIRRAVDKGQLRADQIGAVRNRIFSMAAHYGFEPDDFARLTIMESGGMNPLASNGRCHGIIQFCDGPARGAAAVGYGAKPRDILKLGLLQQLDLVDKYFEHTGLERFGPKISLDDLYLTVLQPSARTELRRDKPLAIAGPQAAYLHVGQDRRAPITRDSIVTGLHQFSNQLLGVPTELAAAPSTLLPNSSIPPGWTTSPGAAAVSQRAAQLGQRSYTHPDIPADEVVANGEPGPTKAVTTHTSR